MTNPKSAGGKRSIVMSFYRAFKSLGAALPTLLGVVLLLGLFLTLVSKQLIASIIYVWYPLLKELRDQKY
jgi:hypothetical protein